MNSLNPMMKVGEQLRDTIWAHVDTRVRRTRLDARIQEVLESVELSPNVMDAYPHELSGGMKQRVCIAMGILLEPKVIIADEPTSALDVVVQRQVMETLRRVQTDMGAAVILVGHDMGLMAQFVDRVGVMYGGKLVEVGPVRDIFKDPLHPYTQLLIGSLPTLRIARGFSGHPGADAVLAQPAAGCMFHPRCPQAMAHCSVDIPALEEIKAGQVGILPPVRRESVVMPVLEAQNVTKVFGSGMLTKGRTVAVDEVSLSINEEKPTVIAIAGESGSGKTTLARLLLGMASPATAPSSSADKICPK